MNTNIFLILALSSAPPLVLSKSFEEAADEFVLSPSQNPSNGEFVKVLRDIGTCYATKGPLA